MFAFGTEFPPQFTSEFEVMGQESMTGDRSVIRSPGK